MNDFAVWGYNLATSSIVILLGAVDLCGLLRISDSAVFGFGVLSIGVILFVCSFLGYLQAEND